MLISAILCFLQPTYTGGTTASCDSYSPLSTGGIPTSIGSSDVGVFTSSGFGGMALPVNNLYYFIFGPRNSLFFCPVNYIVKLTIWFIIINMFTQFSSNS